MPEKHIAREAYLESPQRYMMELFCKRANDFKPSAVFSKKLYHRCLTLFSYNTGDTRAFLAQGSKPTTKLTWKVTNNSFRA